MAAGHASSQSPQSMHLPAMWKARDRWKAGTCGGISPSGISGASSRVHTSQKQTGQILRAAVALDALAELVDPVTEALVKRK